MVKFIWIGAVLCGIANALIYSFTSGLVMAISMVLVAVVGVFLVLFHRHQTRGWENSDLENDYYPIFTYSTIGFAVLTVLALVAFSTAIVLGVVTALIVFIFLANREINYAGKIRGLFVLESLLFKSNFLLG